MKNVSKYGTKNGNVSEKNFNAGYLHVKEAEERERGNELRLDSFLVGRKESKGKKKCKEMSQLINY